MTSEEKAEFKQEIRADIKEAVHDNLGAYKIPKEQHYKDHLFISEIDKERFGQHHEFIESWIKWTDSTITANSTKIRKIHMDELRSWIDSRRVDAGLSNYSWTDSSIIANSTKIRKIHMDELRSSVSNAP
ncbi:MAG: hypothetical protein AAB496_01745 [Patescibacteria group bacterium]